MSDNVVHVTITGLGKRSACDLLRPHCTCGWVGEWAEELTDEAQRHDCAGSSLMGCDVYHSD